jgi:hypothetical protein
MTALRRLAAGTLAAVLVGIALSAVLVLSGCRKRERAAIDTNLPPDTELTSAPAPFAQTNYRIHFFWNGADPDGYVVGYYFAWDDTFPTSWEYTTKTDSMFKASIDTVGETRRHTFYVRSVDNEGKLDGSPARIRFDAWTVIPVLDSLYRVGGPLDPSNPEYDPDAKDTVLMGTPCTWTWGGRDPDGFGADIDYSYRLDSDTFSEFDATQTTTLHSISSGFHFFYVKTKDETGAESFPENYQFTMNYDPDSEIIEPPEPSGTLTIADGDTIWFRWNVRDKEELEGADGGIKEVWIELESMGFLKRFEVGTPEYAEEFYFTSNVSAANEHYIESDNNPTGGNDIHTFRVFAKDVENRFESPSELAEDREVYQFFFNDTATTENLSPAEGETVCPDFDVCWEGVDTDGEVVAYQYVLDPQLNSWQQTQESCVSYEDVEVGPHQFWIRSRDNSDCWSNEYEIVHFFVEDCD